MMWIVLSVVLLGLFLWQWDRAGKAEQELKFLRVQKKYADQQITRWEKWCEGYQINSPFSRLCRLILDSEISPDFALKPYQEMKWSWGWIRFTGWKYSSNSVGAFAQWLWWPGQTVPLEKQKFYYTTMPAAGAGECKKGATFDIGYEGVPLDATTEDVYNILRDGLEKLVEIVSQDFPEIEQHAAEARKHLSDIAKEPVKGGGTHGAH